MLFHHTLLIKSRNVKRGRRNFPNFIRSPIRGFSTRASQVLFVTERKFGRRALNRFSNSGPHLTSQAKPLLDFCAPNDLSISLVISAKSMPLSQMAATKYNSSFFREESQNRSE
jgi:hypothetical protein